MSRCYICGRGGCDSGHYHTECLGNVFRTPVFPQFDYSESELYDLLKEQALDRLSLPGETPMLAFNCKSYRWRTPRAWELVPGLGEYVLDLPYGANPYLPEFRHFYLNFAAMLGLETVPFALVKLRSGEFALFRKRADRTTKEKFPRHVEDFCQLDESPSNMKYAYSMDDAADLIRRFSDTPAISLIRFFERTLYCFIAGCGDVHYKNLRMLCRRVVVGKYDNRVSKYNLEPMTDIMHPAHGDSELAMPLRGKTTGIQRRDFEEFGIVRCQLHDRQIENIFQRIVNASGKSCDSALRRSFLPQDCRAHIRQIVSERVSRLRGA